MVCTFFGHRECYGLDVGVLKAAIEDLIQQGVDTFYVGNQGDFDSMVYRCLKQLRLAYPHIHVSVVLAYLPTGKREEDMSDTMYPEIEGHPRFAIERRNRWMIDASDCCLCYINHTWGGAYKFARQAKRRNLTILNLGNAAI
ncbi:MAG: hypothetical protein ACI3W5_07010 [Faecousia sp.]